MDSGKSKIIQKEKPYLRECVVDDGEEHAEESDRDDADVEEEEERPEHGLGGL